MNRIVRRLRLRAEDEATIRRTAIAFEDALRTASLPDAGGRTLLVRRLALGRIARDAAPQTIAQAMERRVAELGARCVHATDEAAAAAPAVWFRDALEAHVRLALRIAAGDSVAAWYWPLAVPAWSPQADPGTALRQIALSLATRAEAPIALPQWTHALVAGGHAAKLLHALRVADVRPLAHAAGVALPEPATPYRLRRASRPTSRRLSGRLDTAIAQGGRQSAVLMSPDPRAGLLRALLLAAAGDGVADRPAPESARDMSPAKAASSGAMDSDMPAAATPAPAEPPRPATIATTAPAVLDSAAIARPAPRESGAPPAGLAPGNGEDPPAPDSGVPQQPRPAAYSLDGDPTAAGGLLFLLHVLMRLRYDEWLDMQPLWEPLDVARRAMAIAASHLALADDDPAWLLISVPAWPFEAPDHFVAPAIWQTGLCRGKGKAHHRAGSSGIELRDPSGRLLLAEWDDPSLVQQPEPHLRIEAVVRAWLTACRRWLRAYAHIGMADLVLRPAELATTPTHIDVFFDLAQADLRVRSAGLDLDPGWVPWFGRVVAFHYVERGRQ